MSQRLFYSLVALFVPFALTQTIKNETLKYLGDWQDFPMVPKNNPMYIYMDISSVDKDKLYFKLKLDGMSDYNYDYEYDYEFYGGSKYSYGFSDAIDGNRINDTYQFKDKSVTRTSTSRGYQYKETVEYGLEANNKKKFKYFVFVIDYIDCPFSLKSVKDLNLPAWAIAIIVIFVLIFVGAFVAVCYCCCCRKRAAAPVTNVVYADAYAGNAGYNGYPGDGPYTGYAGNAGYTGGYTGYSGNAGNAGNVNIVQNNVNVNNNMGNPGFNVNDVPYQSGNYNPQNNNAISNINQNVNYQHVPCTSTRIDAPPATTAQ